MNRRIQEQSENANIRAMTLLSLFLLVGFIRNRNRNRFNMTGVSFWTAVNCG
jgi:hypothetical protein